MGIAKSPSKGRRKFYVKGTKHAACWYFIIKKQTNKKPPTNQSILWHESNNTEWEDYTPAGCGRAGGVVETAWAYAAGVISPEGLGKTSVRKLLLQGYLAAKPVLRKHWDS